MITEYLIKKTADLVFQRLAEHGRDAGANIRTSAIDVESAIGEHIKELKNWAAEISFRDLLSPKPTTDTYVPLDLFVTPLRLQMDRSKESTKVAFESIFEEPSIRVGFQNLWTPA